MKFKSGLGLLAGAFLILSAGAHSILGWKAMSERLAQTNAPPDLVQGLRMGWLFGGPVMLVLGVLCIAAFLRRFRGERAPLLAPVLISIAYIAYAAFAAISTGGDPFFMLFLVPGVLLAIASIP
jgi:cytochrome c biogenesis factor